jgi:YHS domain-containing protein
MNSLPRDTATRGTSTITVMATTRGHHHESAADDGKVKDPVCEMMVDRHATAHRAQYHGKPSYFCLSGCLSKFMADLARYVEPAAAPKAEAVPDGAIYTCPMHPQIRQVGLSSVQRSSLKVRLSLAFGR